MKSGNLVSTFRRGRNSTSPKNPGPRERPAHRWPDWAPPCLTTAGEIEGIPGQDLIIRLFTDQNPKMRDAWDWAIGLLITGGESPGELHHHLLLNAIQAAISHANRYGNAKKTAPGEIEATYREIAAKARELAALIERTAVDDPVMSYLQPADLREVRIRTPQGLYRLTLMDDEGQPHPDDTAPAARPAAALLRPDLRVRVEASSACTHTPDLLRNVASDAEHWGAQLADPGHHLSPRVSMKLKPKVFVRALVQDLCGAAPPDPAHLATLANAALGLSQPEERVKPHQVIDWLQGFNPAWHPGEALRQKWAP